VIVGGVTVFALHRFGPTRSDPTPPKEEPRRRLGGRPQLP
jgi:hypothetical protein